MNDYFVNSKFIITTHIFIYLYIYLYIFIYTSYSSSLHNFLIQQQNLIILINIKEKIM